VPFEPNYENISPWEIQPGEPTAQYRWFEFYLNTRSYKGKHTVYGAYREYRRQKKEQQLVQQGISQEIREKKVADYLKTIRKAPSKWNQVAEDYDWEFRGQQYDLYLQGERECTLRERQVEIEETAWSLYQVMIKRVREMASYPLTKQTVVDHANGQVVIIEPAGWTLRDIAPLVKATTQLGAIATRSARPHKIELLTALEVLVEEGCCPASVLRQARQAIDQVPQVVMNAFKTASGIDPLKVATPNAPDLYAEIAAEENKKAEARDDN
jgi:uncharacterized protein YacL (UPF0231 family)